MDLLTIDFETYWDSDYTLSKMTTDSYVLDPRFKVHGAAMRLRSMHEKSVYLTDVFLATFLAGIDWSKTALLAHNTAFDGFIITHHYGHKPAFYLDTLSMARAVLGATVGGSLAAVAAHYQLGEKGHTVLDTKGIRDLSPELHKGLAAYAVNDLELCLRAFAKMKPEFSMEELELIDMTIRMFTEPMVRLDKDMLKEEIESERARKQKLIDEVCNGDPSILVSNKQFADLLFMYGVEAPTKISQTTGKETFALAKTDPGFRELLEHEDEAIRTLAEARLDLKSSIAQTRAERLYEVAAADRPWPVMLNYYGAHVTGRWSGGNKQNAQNLPSGRDGKPPVLRNSIMAPPGYEIVVADSSQIEARTLAWLAGQNDLVDTFRNKGDPYCRMASALYKREIHKDTDPNERQVGKTMVLGCFAADTNVLTVNGVKRIVDVQDTDLLWDGTEWVSHSGLVYQGVRETVLHAGVRATPDHDVLTEHGWRGWNEVHTSPSLWTSALSSANLPCSAGNGSSQLVGGTSGSSPSSAALADGKDSSTEATSWLDGPHGATTARRRPRVGGGKTTGRMKTSSQTQCIEHDCSTAYLRALPAAVLAAAGTSITQAAASLSILHGWMTGAHFFSTSLVCPGGMTPSSNSTGSTTTRGTLQETYASFPARRTWRTGGLSRRCNNESQSSRQKLPVYDLAYAGPRNRFTILTADGPVLVHNCGYGMGPDKFRGALKNSTGITITPQEAALAVATYRAANKEIVKFWRQCEEDLHRMAHRQSKLRGCYEVGPHGILLPNGMRIKYPGLLQGSEGFTYSTKNGRTKIYGGKVTENLIQALARIIVAGQMLVIERALRKIGGRVWLMAHDEVCALVPKEKAAVGLQLMLKVMHVPPKWAPDLPLAAEGGRSDRYGTAKR